MIDSVRLDGVKYLTAGRLIKLLQALPQNTRVSPNSVKNLMLWNTSTGYIGFIDFLLGGRVELDEEVDDD